MSYEDRLKTLATVQKGWDALRHYLPPDVRFVADTMEKHHRGTVAAFYDLLDKDAPRQDGCSPSAHGEPEAASPAGSGNEGRPPFRPAAPGGTDLFVIEGGLA